MKTIGVVALLAVALSAGTADAKKHKTFCQKAVKAEKAKVVARKGGVTVYRRGQVVSACSDAKRKAAGLLIMDPGYKVTKVAAANKRCLAFLMTGKGKLPVILVKDLAGKEIGSSETIVGFDNPAGTVGSLSVSSNCAAAWGESVTDASGATTYRVRAKAFGAATVLPFGVVNEIATVNAADDIAHVAIKAAGRKVVVGWTQGGAPQSKTLP